jgi:hypothetical protein
MMSMSVVSDMSLLELMPLVSESAGEVLRALPIMRLSDVVPGAGDDADEDGTGRESPIVPTPLDTAMPSSLKGGNSKWR